MNEFLSPLIESPLQIPLSFLELLLSDLVTVLISSIFAFFSGLAGGLIA